MAVAACFGHRATGKRQLIGGEPAVALFAVMKNRCVIAFQNDGSPAGHLRRRRAGRNCRLAAGNRRQ